MPHKVEVWRYRLLTLNQEKEKMPKFDEIKRSIAYQYTRTDCASRRYGECMGETSVTVRETENFEGVSKADVEKQIAEFCDNHVHT